MPKALFGTIYQDLKVKIENGTYPYQSFLPPESKLVGEYDCSRNTVRRAIGMLADEGAVQPQVGSGVRVIWKPSRRRALGTMTGLESFEEFAANNDFSPSTKVHLFERVIATEKLGERTGFAVGTPLFHAIRLRYYDDVVGQVDHNYLLREAMPDLTEQALAGSLYTYLEDTLGIKVVTSKRRITCDLARKDDSQFMDLSPYGCVVSVENQAFDARGVMVEYTESRNDPHFFCFEDTSRRA